ncbi:MAG: O-antigen ligase family protein [Acidobacteria bacterium]|nr:O-antigen ligase family protein [Acidobacteriota bacterium]
MPLSRIREFDLQTWILLCLAGALALTQVSIAASQGLLACSIIGYVWYRRRTPEPYVLPSFAWPLAGLFLWTLVSIAFSQHLLLNLVWLKKFSLFAIAFIIPDLCRRNNACATIYRAVFGVAAMAAAAGLLEYFTSSVSGPDHRVTGLMSHWMTYSGLLMLIVAGLCGYLLSYGLRKGWWSIPLGLAALTGIFLSQTRSTLAASIISVLALLIAAKRYRWVPVLFLAAVVGYLAAPANFRDRINAGFDLRHQHTAPRVELLETGLRMIAANPLVGVGPASVGIEAPGYKGPDARPEWTYIHLHNNMLQIAAERGIPGLLLWLWFMWRITVDALKGVRRANPGACTEERSLAATAAFGASIAMIAGGMFEYNFGDSEILMLFLYMASAPYAYQRAGLGIESAGHVPSPAKAWSRQ